MDFNVFLSGDALSDLQRIVTCIAPHNAAAAAQMGHHLPDAALSLRSFPERGRMVPEFRRPDVREIIFRSYRIIYRINQSDRSLEIVRFWHGARGFPPIPL
jgi:plasmid stabilization system protein ParE